MLTLIPPKNKPLGLVLLSATEVCNSSLIVRSDKPSSIVIYDDNLGTVPATHYTLSDSLVHYNDNCTDLSYFISTRETAIATSLLKRLDAEVLIWGKVIN